jgi:predicted DNA-binding protein with PD1-like motif
LKFLYPKFGTILFHTPVAYDEKNDKILPHIHISVGVKPHSGIAHTSHLLNAKVQFLTEMLVFEVISPKMGRVVDTNLYNLALLKFK